MFIKVCTCLWLNKYFQRYGSCRSIFILAFRMAAVCSLVNFCNVGNREDVLYLTFAMRWFLYYFVLCTAFQGRRIVVKVPKQIFWTIVIKINPTCQTDIRRCFSKTFCRFNGWAFWRWTWDNKKAECVKNVILQLRLYSTPLNSNLPHPIPPRFPSLHSTSLHFTPFNSPSPQ